MGAKTSSEKKFAETYGGPLISALPLLVMLVGILVCAFTGYRSPRCYCGVGVVSVTLGFFIYIKISNVSVKPYLMALVIEFLAQ